MGAQSAKAVCRFLTMLAVLAVSACDDGGAPAGSMVKHADDCAPGTEACYLGDCGDGTPNQYRCNEHGTSCETCGSVHRGPGPTSEPFRCAASVEAHLVIYEQVCWHTWVQCDGKQVTEDGPTTCDSTDITCTEPDRTEIAKWDYQYTNDTGRGCQLCSNADGATRCTSILGGCGAHMIEHVVAGSAATGPHPCGDCCDTDAGR